MKTIKKTMRLIHYGASEFDPKKFTPVVNREFVKPFGGLWTSPVDSNYGWLHWCKSEDFRIENLEPSFEFEYEGNILVVDGIKDARGMLWVTAFKDWMRELKRVSSFLYRWPDFASMRDKGVDAIHLTVQGEQETRFSRTCSLYGWDCESVFIMNPEGIKAVKQTKNRKAVSK